VDDVAQGGGSLFGCRYAERFLALKYFYYHWPSFGGA
jgi:hypothetical protein